MAKRGVTIRDIAEKLGVSLTAVSFVLNNRDRGISEETRERVMNAALEMGYRRRPRFTEREDRVRVAFLTRSIHHFHFHTSFFATVYHHLIERCQAADMDLMLLEFSPHHGEKTARQFQQLDRLDIDCFLTVNRDTAAMLKEHDRRVILVQAGAVLADTMCVYCDDREAGRQAADHAYEMGHRQAGGIFMHGQVAANTPRYAGFRERFCERGGQLDSAYCWEITRDQQKGVEELKGYVTARPADRIPSIFYCFADHLMFSCLRAFSGAGIRVPEDVSLIGTDDLYWGRFTVPAFTTVNLREDLFADHLLTAIRHLETGASPYHIAVPVRFVPRESVRRLARD